VGLSPEHGEGPDRLMVGAFVLSVIFRYPAARA
jgi:hypothetical protein